MNAEQRARELLAEEARRVGEDALADAIMDGGSNVAVEISLRAITHALTRPAPTEAEVEAKLEAQAWRDAWVFAKEHMLLVQGIAVEPAREIAESQANAMQLSIQAQCRMARAALGVG